MKIFLKDAEASALDHEEGHDEGSSSIYYSIYSEAEQQEICCS